MDKTLEKSVDYLRDIAGARTPEKPIRLGKTLGLSDRAKKLNVLCGLNPDTSSLKHHGLIKLRRLLSSAQSALA